MKEKNEIKAKGTYLPISFKQSVMIGRNIKGMNVKKAIQLLEEVSILKKPIKFMKFNKDMGHKRGISAGRYPVKASKEIIKVLKNLIANATNMYFDEEDIMISKVIVNRAVSKEKMATRRLGKSTHIEIIGVPKKGAVLKKKEKTKEKAESKAKKAKKEEEKKQEGENEK